MSVTAVLRKADVITALQQVINKFLIFFNVFGKTMRDKDGSSRRLFGAVKQYVDGAVCLAAEKKGSAVCI